MRTLLYSSVLLTYFFVSSASSCNHDKHKNNCHDVACTMIFGAVTIRVTDSDGKPVILNEAYTLREGSNEKITYTGTGIENGTYTVIDDSYQKNLVNSTATFYFTGIKDGKEVVKEKFVIGADCCHVSKKEGPESVVAK
jgi:hypothetical protein